jgi:hypothetical protein
MLIISSDLRSLKDGHSRRVLPKWSTTTSDSEHPKPRTRGTDGNSTSSGEGSIYPYPHGFRAYVWVTTSTGRKQRKYVSGKTRDEVREKYLALHQAARRGQSPLRCQLWPAIWRAGWPTLSAQLSPRRQRLITRSSAGCTSFPGLVPSALTSYLCDVQDHLARPSKRPDRVNQAPAGPRRSNPLLRKEDQISHE